MESVAPLMCCFKYIQVIAKVKDEQWRGGVERAQDQSPEGIPGLALSRISCGTWVDHPITPAKGERAVAPCSFDALLALTSGRL